MKLQLNGYEVDIDRMYAYKTYAGLLCGMIDSRRNDHEEEEAKKELKAFSTMQNANLYLPPHRNKAPLDSFHPDAQEMIKEDYLEGRYDAGNFPEEHLASYWVFLELVSYDDKFTKDKDGCCTGLNVACNIKSIDMSAIETYLYENLTCKVWKRESVDFTP